MPKDLTPDQREDLRRLIVEDGMGIDRAIYRLDLPIAAARRIAKEGGWQRASINTKLDDDGVLRRTCCGCKSRKTLDEFPKSTALANGRTYECKACTSTRVTAWKRRKASQG